MLFGSNLLVSDSFAYDIRIAATGVSIHRDVELASLTGFVEKFDAVKIITVFSIHLYHFQLGEKRLKHAVGNIGMQVEVRDFYCIEKQRFSYGNPITENSCGACEIL